MTYDDKNIFARILRGEISCDRIYEDEQILAFKDIYPKAPVHILVIPKIPCVSFLDFTATAAAGDIAHFFKVIAKIVQDLGIGDSGFKLVANTGRDGGQEVPHFHFHIISGSGENN